MRYLAVEHFGRGRGALLHASHRRTVETVNEAVQMRRAQLQSVWAIARAADADSSSNDTTAAALLPIVAASAREVTASIQISCLQEELGTREN